MIWLEKRFNYKIFIAWTHEQPFVIVADYKVAKVINFKLHYLRAMIIKYKNFIDDPIKQYRNR